LLKILFCAVIWIDGVVVANCIRTADTSLLLFLTNRMDRHQPQNCDTELLEIIEFGGNAFEIAFS
jgi:hypothetical protein